MAALRQSQGIVLCQALGSAPCDEGVGVPKIKDAAVKEEPEEFTLRVGKDVGRRLSWTQRGLLEHAEPSTGRFRLRRAVPDVV